MLIGITGKKSAGKTTLAKKLLYIFGGEIYVNKSPLLQICGLAGSPSHDMSFKLNIIFAMIADLYSTMTDETNLSMDKFFDVAKNVCKVGKANRNENTINKHLVHFLKDVLLPSYFKEDIFLAELVKRKKKNTYVFVENVYIEEEKKLLDIHIHIDEQANIAFYNTLLARSSLPQEDCTYTFDGFSSFSADYILPVDYEEKEFEDLVSFIESSASNIVQVKKQ